MHRSRVQYDKRRSPRLPAGLLVKPQHTHPDNPSLLHSDRNKSQYLLQCINGGNKNESRAAEGLVSHSPGANHSPGSRLVQRRCEPQPLEGPVSCAAACASSAASAAQMPRTAARRWSIAVTREPWAKSAAAVPLRNLKHTYSFYYTSAATSGKQSAKCSS